MEEELEEEVDGMPGRRGQILWIRGLARLQTQVRACRLPPRSVTTCVYIYKAVVDIYLHLIVVLLPIKR